MLKQLDIAFKAKDISNVQSELAVKIHGAVMHSIPQDKAELMHVPRYHPFSLFTVPYENDGIFVTRLSSLSKEADCILETVQQMESINIKGIHKPVSIIKTGNIITTDLDNIANSYDGRRYRLTFLTPSGFKILGHETSFPDVSMHFLSVINRLNEFENMNIDFDDFRKLFYELTIDDWQLKNVSYNITGRLIPGMIGHMDVFFPKESEKTRLLKRILLYACFSGTGGRTGMGMGGFIMEKIIRR